MNIRSRLMLFLALSSVAGAGASMVVACSSDDTVTTQDGGGTDAPNPPNPPPPPPPEPTDGGGDALPDVVPPSFDNFPAVLTQTVCQKVHDCCLSEKGVTTTAAVCEGMVSGWEGSNVDLPPDVIDAGKVTYDTSTAKLCLQLLMVLPCGRVDAPTLKSITSACWGAAKGTIALNGTGCRTSAECVATGFCDLTGGDAGTCRALLASGSACTADPQCSYRGANGFCQQGTDGGTCTAPLPTGTACDFNTGSVGCASGSCDDTTFQCGDAGELVPVGDAGVDFCNGLK